jgi:hypothetical protein
MVVTVVAGYSSSSSGIRSSSRIRGRSGSRSRKGKVIKEQVLRSCIYVTYMSLKASPLPPAPMEVKWLRRSEDQRTRSCCHLGLSWGLLVSSWAVSGPSWGYLEAILGHLVLILAIFGLSWGVLGSSWGLPGGILGSTWAILG